MGREQRMAPLALCLWVVCGVAGCGSDSGGDDGGTTRDASGADAGCAPNATETRPTPACGSETRTCGSDRTWGAWTQVAPDQADPECLLGEAQFAGRDGCVGEKVRYLRCGSSCTWDTTPSECGGGCAGVRRAEPRDEEEICVPAGLFRRGCDESTPDVARTCMPRHDVYLSAFYVDRYQVDVRRYDLCVADGGCTPLQPFEYDGNRYTDYLTPREPLLPVWTATHEQAEAFCAWDGAELATGAQWERAAAGVQQPPDSYPFYVEFPYERPFCELFPNSIRCDGLEFPRAPDRVYDDSGFPRRENSVGLGGLFNYFEWTRDTTAPYAPSDPVAIDPVVTSGDEYEMRGAPLSQIDRYNFEEDIRERHNTSMWGNTERASFRCARRAEGER